MLAVENVLSFSNIDYIAGLLARRLIRPRGQMPLDVLKRIGFESPWEFNHSGVSYKLYNPWRLEGLMDDFGFTRLESMTVGHELRILRRSHIVPESVLTSIEVRLEKLFRGFPWRVLAYSGEFYVGLFRNDSDRKSHDGHREKIRNIDQTTPAREPVWARTREE